MLLPGQLPIDASALAMQHETCHCVADIELDNRYNTLRAEEHARKEGKCGPHWSTEVADSEVNRERNRYASVVPWDHSRVLLPVEEGANDYINASWIELGSRTYIATQGPLKSTMHDFWQMVYAYGGDRAVIIMLTALHEHSVEKCAKYWPDNKNTPIVFPKEKGFRFGLTVTMDKSNVNNGQYKISSFTITPSDPHFPPHTVTHVYYHSWLDLNKPNADADIRALIHMVNNELRNPASPQIVHCSAGIGRTGTFIAIDALLARIDKSITPAVIPKYVPVWLGDTKLLQYRTCPFTGATDARGKLGGNTQLLSKFDLSTVSGSASVSQRTTVSQGGLLSPAPEDEVNHKADTLASVRSTHTYETEVVGGHRDSEFYDASSGSHTLHPDGSGNENGDEASSSPADDVPKQSSAKSGPVIKKVAAKITSVAPEVFLESPRKVDVINWFEEDDPIMSTVRTMRKQRPKMVQGRQQLGYIYDQFEVGQQLARVDDGRPTVTRSQTMSSVPDLSCNTPRQAPKKPRRLFTFNHGSHKHETNETRVGSDGANTPRKSKLKSLFSAHSLK